MTKGKLIYITGISGSGKSTVCEELKRRGYAAFDTDKDGLAFFYNNKTKEPLKRRVTAEERTVQWRAQHTWRAERSTFKRLAAQAKDSPVFICGVTANDGEELWDLFSKVFALVVPNEEQLANRINGRGEDEYGKNPHELKSILNWQRSAEDDYKKRGAILIDASLPTAEIVDTIVEQSFAEL
jgi:broad-specificity NMP kinase